MLKPSHRLLGVFPHPDDESLAAGLLLQQAKKVGAPLRLLLLTSGEANTWPLRVMERTLWPRAAHRLRFAARREEETRQALDRLGIDPACAHFLRWPDGQLAQLALTNPQPFLEALRAHLAAFQPTHLLLPLLADRHPDHSAAAALVLAASMGQKAELLGYPAHSPLRRQPHKATRFLPGQGDEVARKALAIACHQSQLVFRRRFHMSFATGQELYFSPTQQDPEQKLQGHLVGRSLRVSFSLPLSWRSARASQLEIFAQAEELIPCSFPLPWRAARPITLEKGKVAVVFRGWAWAGQLEVTFPTPPSWVALRIHRPLLLFTETGFSYLRTQDQLFPNPFPQGG
jgi:LmbE family N-acetylglucosaminyl deacetylase